MASSCERTPSGCWAGAVVGGDPPAELRALRIEAPGRTERDPRAHRLLQSAGVVRGDAIETARELLALGSGPTRTSRLGASSRASKRNTRGTSAILADLETEIGRLDQIYDADDRSHRPRRISPQVMESLLDSYRAGNLLGGRLPVVLDGAFDGLAPEARDAAVRRAEPQHRRAVDRRDRRPRSDEERDPAGGTIVLWPESGEEPALEPSQRSCRNNDGSRGGPQRGRRVRRLVPAQRQAGVHRPLRRRCGLARSGRRAAARRPRGRRGVLGPGPRRSPKSIELVPSDVIVCANQAAMVFEIHVTLAAPEGEPPTTMIMDAVEMFVLDDDGKISELRAYWDMSRARSRA